MVVLRQLFLEENERINRKVLSNGDIYLGDFKGELPHGKGKYMWSDGTVYDGEWEEGKMTGKGQIQWAAGPKYEGQFSGGYLHGFGTFTRPDGSEYRGSWRMNIQHGLGKKQYPNLDSYEGCWKEGVHEGNGRYSWSNGNVYVGNWRSGIMNGRGIMKWITGDVFDGSWSNGMRHGSVNPNSYACIIGLVWAFVSNRWSIEMPSIMDGSVSIMAKAGTGTAMFSMGIFMALQEKLIACGPSLTVIGMVLRFIAGPAAMAIGSIVVGLHGDVLRVAIIQAALPQSITSFIFAKEYGLHAEVLSTAVIFGMIVSLPVLIAYYAALELVH